MTYRSLTMAAALLVADCFVLPAAADVLLFQDTFGRGSAAAPSLLDDSIPDVRPGSETWLAPTLFQTNGNIMTPGFGKACLEFAPGAPGIYTLRVTADPADTGIDTDWISLGFASSTGGNPWDNVGPWMVMRGNGQATTFPLGTANRDNVTAGTSAQEFSIVLDTTAALWSAEWFIGNTSVRTYTYTGNPTINYVHLGGNLDATTMGTFDNFSLSFVPEPSTWMILFFGIFSLAARRGRVGGSGEPNGRILPTCQT